MYITILIYLGDLVLRDVIVIRSNVKHDSYCIFLYGCFQIQIGFDYLQYLWCVWQVISVGTITMIKYNNDDVANKMAM